VSALAGEGVRIAAATEFNVDLAVLCAAVEIRDDFARAAAEGFGAIDPEHRFVALGLHVRLLDADAVAENPDFVRALPPVSCAAGADGDRRRLVRDDGELDGGRNGRRGRQTQNQPDQRSADCGARSAEWGQRFLLSQLKTEN
jgi:hypothetical protein